MKSKIYWFNKIITSIIIAILIIIILILSIAFIQVNILNKDYANILGYSYFQVATGSMEPTIKIDDIILIRLNSDIQENDIITYKSKNEFITHRLIQKNDDSLITKGDNNNSEDDPIKKEDVIGKVVFTVKNVAVWKMVFADKKVFILLIITVMIFIVSVVYNEEKKD